MESRLYRMFFCGVLTACVSIPVTFDKSLSDSAESIEIPIEEACHEAVEGWSSSWSTIEEDTLVLMNEMRAQGADCRSEGQFAPAGPLTMNPYLRCSSRYHAFWMGDFNDLIHESPGGDLGDDPWQRIASTGFPGSATGENIAAGYGSPEAVVAGWMSSDGHCANIMSPESNVVGVGYSTNTVSDYFHWWTTNFGRE
jgi:uncharacterized protein YkwD